MGYGRIQDPWATPVLVGGSRAGWEATGSPSLSPCPVTPSVPGGSRGRPSPQWGAWCEGAGATLPSCLSRIRASLGASGTQPPPQRLRVMVWTWPSEGQRRLWLYDQSSPVLAR